MKRCTWLVLISLLLPFPVSGAELLMPGAQVKQPGIFFPDGPMVYEVLKRAEEHPMLLRENQKLSELVAQDNAALTEAARRAEMDTRRIQELGMQLDNCFVLQKQTVKTMEDVQKIKSGTWLDWVKNAALILVIGGALGYAAAKQ